MAVLYHVYEFKITLRTQVNCIPFHQNKIKSNYCQEFIINNNKPVYCTPDN